MTAIRIKQFGEILLTNTKLTRYSCIFTTFQNNIYFPSTTNVWPYFIYKTSRL